MEFSGKTVLITGAASGIGFECYREFGKNGASIVMCDVNEAAMKEKSAEFSQDGINALTIKTDVRNYEEVKAACGAAFDKFGSLDAVICCAGGTAKRMLGSTEPTFWDTPIEVYDWGIDVNLKGALFFCRAVIGTMIEQKRGVMIVLGSIDGVTGSAWSVDYSAAKSGMIGMVKGLALLGAPHNVRACCVSPGPVLTRAAMANMPTPMGRAAEPQEVVDLILYLASDKAAFISGDNYLIDGARACMVR